MINEKFVILGALIALPGQIGYFLDTLRGKAKPNRVTWFLWALAPMLAFAAQINGGVGILSLSTFMAGFGPAMILLASIYSRKAYWKITKFDYICGALSLIGLILWAITKDGNLAIVFAILADGLAALPTVVKSYNYPETESSLIFGLSAIGTGITLLAIQDWSFVYYAFPLYLFIICIVLFSLIQFKLGEKIKNLKPA